MAEQLKLYGQTAYEAYVKSCGGKSVNGEDLPTWDHLKPSIRTHWMAAANAVVDDVDDELQTG